MLGQFRSGYFSICQGRTD